MKDDQEHNEKFLIGFSDLFSILRRSKRKILLTACVCGMIGVLFAVIKPIRFQAEGTFRERGIKESAIHSSPSVIHLLGGGGSNDSEATSLMLSRKILKEVIEKLHLQGDLQAVQDIESIPKLVKQNIQLAIASFKNSVQPTLKDLYCPLKIDSLTYSGEIPIHLEIKFIDDKQFEVFDRALFNRLIGQGRLGVPFQYEQLSFTLVAIDSKPLTNQTFKLRIDSLSNTAQTISQILDIKPSKTDKNLLKINYEHRNRHLASDIVNEVMHCFQSYSKKYHADIAANQLNYLSQRRDQLSQNLTNLMHKHADFLAVDLYGSGFLESNKEMDFLARSQHEYKQKLLDNELEIKRLTHIKLDDFTHYDRYSANDGDTTIINTIFSNMRSLKQQRDALEIEIQKKAISQGTNHKYYFELQIDELKEVQKNLRELREIKEQFQQGNQIDQPLKLLNDPRYLLKVWFDRLQNVSKNDPAHREEMRESFQFYLNNLERLFGVHERILQERLTHQQNHVGEYQGISLEVATDLYRDFSKQLIQMESTIRQNTFFIHQIEDPQFEITSLSAGLNDPISAEIIQKASHLVLNLRDQNNQSIREQERIKEELNLERTFLILHLEQMVQLMELNKQLIDEKIFALQNVSLELIHQQISLLEKNLQDYLKARLNNLEQERSLIKRHLENIHTEMAQLPQKWVSEQLLTQEVATNHLIVEEIAKLVETKNISHNLEVIQSAPVDLAIPPIHPLTPKIFLLGILGLLIGAFLSACYALIQSLNQGLRVSSRLVEQMGFHVSGELSSPLPLDESLVSKTQLETMRRVQIYFDTARLEERTAHLPENKLLLLIEGDGPHYARLLASLLTKRGLKVLSLDLNFHPSSNHSPGILQYLKEELTTLPIQTSESGDYVSSGGENPFANELITSKAFQSLIDNLQPSYDWILAITPAHATSVEAESLIPLFPFAAVTLRQEKIEELHFYTQFLKSHPKHKLSFILST